MDKIVFYLDLAESQDLQLNCEENEVIDYYNDYHESTDATIQVVCPYRNFAILLRKIMIDKRMTHDKAYDLLKFVHDQTFVENDPISMEMLVKCSCKK